MLAHCDILYAIINKASKRHKKGANVVSVNLIFHIVSAITFVILIWYLLHLQSQLGFLREVMASLASGQSRVKVDWPDVFLKRLAAALGIAFQTSGQKLPPQKIDIKLWAEANRELGLTSIRWSVPTLGLGVAREPDLSGWQARLEESFGGKIKIEWSKASAKVQ